MQIAIQHISSMIDFSFSYNIPNKYDNDIIQLAKSTKYNNSLAKHLPSVYYLHHLR